MATTTDGLRATKDSDSLITSLISQLHRFDLRHGKVQGGTHPVKDEVNISATYSVAHSSCPEAQDHVGRQAAGGMLRAPINRAAGSADLTRPCTSISDTQMRRDHSKQVCNYYPAATLAVPSRPSIGAASKGSFLHSLHQLSDGRSELGSAADLGCLAEQHHVVSSPVPALGQHSPCAQSPGCELFVPFYSKRLPSSKVSLSPAGAAQRRSQYTRRLWAMVDVQPPNSHVCDFEWQRRPATQHCTMGQPHLQQALAHDADQLQSSACLLAAAAVARDEIMQAADRSKEAPMAAVPVLQQQRSEPQPHLPGGFSSSSRFPSLPAAAALHQQQVRGLLTYGGRYQHSSQGGTLTYTGGAQRLVVLNRLSSIYELCSQLCGLTGGGIQQGTLKYILPGSEGPPTFVDLNTDADMRLMWEEWDDFCATRSSSGVKLQLYLDSRVSINTSSASRKPKPDVQATCTDSTSTGGDAPSHSFALSSHPPPHGPCDTPVNGADAVPQSSKGAVPVTAGLRPVADLSAGHAAEAAFDGAAGDAAQLHCVVAWDRQGPGLGLKSALVCESDSYQQLAPAAVWPWLHDRTSNAPHLVSSGNDVEVSTHSDLFVTITENLLTAAGMVSTNGRTEAQYAYVDKNDVRFNNPHTSGAAGFLGELDMPVLHSSSHRPPPPDNAVMGAEESTASQEPGEHAAQGQLDGGEHDAAQLQPPWQGLVSELRRKLDVLQPEQLQVVRFLGGGAFGQVYLARWDSTEVAVKCLPHSVLMAEDGSPTNSSQNAAMELLREASMLASLHHPNIVSCFGVVLPPSTTTEGMGSSAMCTSRAASNGSQAVSDTPMQLEQTSSNTSRTTSVASLRASSSTLSGPAVVTEYMSAGSLHSAITSKPAWLNSNMAKVKLLLDTAKGLAYLHSKKLVHFDLKSANLLVTIKDGVPCVKIADMGLTKARSQTYVTGVDSLRGTLPWIAPEILKHPHHGVTEAADIYSFGVVMWELWTGQEPFEGLPLHALLHQLASPAGLVLPVPGSAAWQEAVTPPEPAPGWADVMQQCWRPAQQRPSATQLITQLEAVRRRLRQIHGAQEKPHNI